MRRRECGLQGVFEPRRIIIKGNHITMVLAALSRSVSSLATPPAAAERTLRAAARPNPVHVSRTEQALPCGWPLKAAIAVLPLRAIFPQRKTLSGRSCDAGGHESSRMKLRMCAEEARNSVTGLKPVAHADFFLLTPLPSATADCSAKGDRPPTTAAATNDHAALTRISLVVSAKWSVASLRLNWLTRSRSLLASLDKDAAAAVDSSTIAAFC
ncbi:hypothetical protein GA0061105_1395 [Rhizobium aethiopicum]|uniref:Uncharacterized protein n=1 Tax=Rhizobium aethiopicum TaxID=1138170 RepID=A0A1C3YCL7_9HYPH|nr:hypothetical protein GA0061105_1395 [Rhizobium aethiopicum]